VRFTALALGCCMLIAVLAAVAPARAQKKDYLTQQEADKIRDAQSPSERIKLFVSFAADRIKKLQYEFAHPEDSVHRSDRLNRLINDYTGSVDDAGELIDLGVQNEQNIRDGIKEMQKRAPEFLAYLKQLDRKGTDLADYKDNLDDAIEATQDAMQSAKDADKELAPPPVRRRR
jgi:uncharacterized protein YdcH (DUF465 family)